MSGACWCAKKCFTTASRAALPISAAAKPSTGSFDRVRYVSSDYDHAHAYWATLDRLTPGTFATLDAQFTGPNRIDVKTSELGAFTLELAGHPKFANGQAIAVTIDGKTVTATTSGSR